MNYKSQLKGWAVDRVIELYKINPSAFTWESLKKDADELATYCYEPEKEFDDCIRSISEHLKSSPDAADKVEQLIAELSVIQEDIERQLALAAKANGHDKVRAVQ